MSTTLISVEEYLHTDYSPDCDYVDGVVLERNVGEYDHSRLQGLLVIWFGSREQQFGIRVFPEQRVQVRATRFRVPDVCVVRQPWPHEPIFRRPPFLCIEILSDEDRMTRMQDKIADFLQFGVAYVWVIDPESRRAWIHTADGSQEVKDGLLRTSDPDIAVPLSELFSALENS